MTLQSIQIVNVKGIQNKTFTLNIIPNKPSLLYAPNGFGKSSFAIAFDSLTGPRLALHKDNNFRGDDTNLPSLEILYEKHDGTVVNLTADNNSNTIKTELDYFVINNKVKAKATPMQFGGRTNYTASLNIDAIELIGAIPPETALGYSVITSRAAFGNNGKILQNLDPIMTNAELISLILDSMGDFQRLTQVRNNTSIQRFKDHVNLQQGTADQIINWIEENELGTLDSIAPLKVITDKLANLGLGYGRRGEYYLAVLQILELYITNAVTLKAACIRKMYVLEKNSYVESFRAFNSTWKDIRPREVNGKLIVEFPKAHNISNGQRDILCLIALLEVARRKLKKQASILIVDEVFDYLDEGNLIAAQYYITEFIQDFKRQGRRIYPLILTHLNPGYFKNYAFSKMKTYFLDTRTATVSQSFRNLIINRTNPSIEDDVSRCLLHYHTDIINKRVEFEALGLRPTWGEANHFITHINAEMVKYVNNQPDYDPFAICCALRRRIEERIYETIPGAIEKAEFLSTHLTKNKLMYAEGLGITIPEFYYLLGNVYNEGMHWKQDRDNESPLKAKLENGTIRKLVSDICR